MEPGASEEPKNSEIQRIVIDYLEGIIDSSRDFQVKTGISHAMFGRYKRMESSMSVAKVEHIISKYPDLKKAIANYLRGNTDTNNTLDIKDAASYDEMKAALWALTQMVVKVQKLEKDLEDARKTKRPQK